jgi:hypothetical protein
MSRWRPLVVSSKAWNYGYASCGLRRRLNSLDAMSIASPEACSEEPFCAVVSVLSSVETRWGWNRIEAA